MKLDLNESNSIRLAYGLHSQTEDLRIYQLAASSNERPNSNLEFSKSHHFVAAFERRLTSHSRLILEGYYQYLFDIPVVGGSSFSMINFDQDFAFNETLISTGLGKNVGVDLTIERFLKDNYYWLATGSIFDSNYRGGDGVWRGTRYDQGYYTSVLFGREFNRGSSIWGLNFRGSFFGGLRYSPVDEAASLARMEIVDDESRAFESQYPRTISLDITASYRRNHKSISELWALQIKNLASTQSEYFDYNLQTNQIEIVKEGFLLPVLSYKIEF